MKEKDYNFEIILYFVSVTSAASLGDLSPNWGFFLETGDEFFDEIPRGFFGDEKSPICLNGNAYLIRVFRIIKIVIIQYRSITVFIYVQFVFASR